LSTMNRAPITGELEAVCDSALRRNPSVYVFEIYSREISEKFDPETDCYKAGFGFADRATAKRLEHPRRERVLLKVPFRSAQVHRHDATFEVE
jgi:hypothetical protein